MGEAALTSVWRIRACLRQGGLSRNKVSVGEPADGSPPKKNRRLEFFVELQSPPFFWPRPLYFLHRIEHALFLDHFLSMASIRQFFCHRFTERQQAQPWSFSVHRNGGTTVEMHFIPTIWYDIASMHV